MAGERPDSVSKLAIYLMDKEPLIYLFIINSDFIDDTEGKYLGPSIAGVAYENRRVKFFYKPEELKKLEKEELFFLVIHEAFHIFKKHLTRHSKLENFFLRNVAEDAIINYEILKANYSYAFVPKMPEGGITVPVDFLQKYRDLGEDAIVTERLYHWYMKQKKSKNDLLQPGMSVRIKSSGETGVVEERKDGSCVVRKKSLEDIKKDAEKSWSQRGQDTGEKEEHDLDNLTPILFPGRGGQGMPISLDGDIEIQAGFDKHFEENKDEDYGVEEQIFTRKIVEQAKKMETSCTSKSAGSERGNLLSKLEELLKPKINWRKEMNKKINLYYSENSYAKEKRKSFINYPWNPRSRYGILGKYNIEERINKETFIIFAVDTSGSCFSDKYEMERFFTEVDAAAKELEFQKKGHIITLQWDNEVAEGLKIYRKDDWRRFKVKGGGGTSPKIIFRYLEKVFKPHGNGYVVNENGIKFTVPDKKKLPLLFVLTDGVFFGNLQEQQLRLYENNSKNVVFFTRREDRIYKGANIIKYE